MLVLALSLLSFSPLQQPTGPCPLAWQPTFGTYPGVAGTVHALAALDDGGGVALYVGGDFDSAAYMPIRRIGRFDGATWSAIGEPDATTIRAVTVHGGGLHAAGARIDGGVESPWVGRWDGFAWHTIGGLDAPGRVHALATFDDGSGDALFAAGTFTHAGGVPVASIAKWDGATWSPVGYGLRGDVRALVVHDDGGGRALFAAGSFLTSQGAPADHIARWDGSSWTAVGAGPDGTEGIASLVVGDIGTGPALCAGGTFTSIGGVPAQNVARWDGASWAPLGGGVPIGVTALALQTLADGTVLHAASASTTTWHFDGGAWTAIASASPGAVHALAPFQGTLYKGGAFQHTGGKVAASIARRDGGAWGPVVLPAADGPVLDVITFDDGSGPALFAAGGFTTIGGVEAPRIARFDGAAWTKIATVAHASEHVRTLAAHDDGTGPALYAGGLFGAIDGVTARSIAKWDGVSWSSLGNGVWGDIQNTVSALETFDDGTGPVLFVGGVFEVAGSTGAKGIARWNGQTWLAAGSQSAAFYVRAMTVLEGSGPPQLWATDGSSVRSWTGSSWNPVTSFAMPTEIRALTTVDTGPARRLVAGGSHVGVWMGTHWTTFSPLGPTSVRSLLTTHIAGTQVVLASGMYKGVFTVARFDGITWSALGGPVAFEGSGATWFVPDSPIAALYATEFAGQPVVLAAGSFLHNTVSGDARLALYGCPAPGVWTTMPGCSANPDSLSATGSKFSSGAAIGFALATQHVERGAAILFAGTPANDANDCGIVYAGIGELMIASAPIALGVAPLEDHLSSFSLAVPSAPALVGLALTFQAAAIGDAASGPLLTLSNGLWASLGP